MTTKILRNIKIEESPITPILIGLCAGLFTGLGEATLLGINKFFFGEIHILHSPHFAWMSPLTNMVVFSVLGVIFFLINHIKPNTISTHSSLVLFTLISAASLLLLFHSLPFIMVLSLSLGFTIFCSRVACHNIPKILSIITQSLKICVPAVLCLAITLVGRELFLERYTMAHLPDPISEKAPNVLLIVLDTVRSKSLSLYGYERDTTPKLKEFANTGVKFDRAISTAPWTLPSHASMFTGQYAHQLSADFRKPLDETFPTIAEKLQNSGYLTAGFVGNLIYCSYVYGLNRGFIHYEDFDFSLGEFAVSSSIIRKIFGMPNFRWFNYYELLNRKKAPHINQAFLEWIDRTKTEGRPFFAFLNYFDAHEPYLPPAPYNQMYANGRQSLPFANLWKKYSLEESRSLQNLYEGSIAYLDSQIGNLLEALRSKGILDNTIVVITSDHGEEFSEHGIPSHGHSLYMPSIHVPLVIVFPKKIPAGRTVSEWVSLRDLPATILSLVSPNAQEQHGTFPGTSLARHWVKKETGNQDVIDESPIHSELRYASGLPEWFPVSHGDMKSIITQNIHYILGGDGKEEIFYLAQDPWEERNLSDTQLGIELASCLKNQMYASFADNSNSEQEKGLTLTSTNSPEPKNRHAQHLASCIKLNVLNQIPPKPNSRNSPDFVKTKFTTH